MCGFSLVRIWLRNFRGLDKNQITKFNLEHLSGIFLLDLAIVNRGVQQSSLLYVFVRFFDLDRAQNTIAVYL